MSSNIKKLFNNFKIFKPETDSKTPVPNSAIPEVNSTGSSPTPENAPDSNTEGLDLEDLISSGSDEGSKDKNSMSVMVQEQAPTQQSKSSIDKIGQCILTKSTELNLKGENLVILPESLKECRHVTKLNLSRNNLTSLPIWFGEVFENLTSLNLSKNGLFHLPKNFSNLEKLRELNLAYNKFEFMPRPVLQLKSAQLLNLSHNVILFIPSDITQMENLVTLDICVNRLMNLPPEMSKMKSLKQLYVEGNCFLPSEMKFVMKIATTKYNSTQSELTSISEPSSDQETEMQDFEVDDKEELVNWLKEEDPDLELDQLLPTPKTSSKNLRDLITPNGSLHDKNTILEEPEETEEEKDEKILARKSVRKIAIPTKQEIDETLSKDESLKEVKEEVVSQDEEEKIHSKNHIIASVKSVLKLNLTQVENSKPQQVKTARKMEREAKRAKERVNLLYEILDSETKYVQFLNVLYDLYFIPLTTGTVYNPKNKKKLLVPLDQAYSMFPPDLATIIQFNNSLTENISQKFKDSKQNPMDICIGDVFIKFGPFFKIYSRYMSKYEKSIDNVMQCQAKNLDFSKWLKSNQKKSQSSGLSLKSLLIMPVQRIPRYQLLLSSLIKNTEKDHPDYKNLCDANVEMESMAEFQDKKINEATNKVIVQQIAEKLKIVNSSPSLLTFL
jgi:Leucine-rich repeat (LRR) protein